jgi:hypothetical protein
MRLHIPQNFAQNNFITDHFLVLALVLGKPLSLLFLSAEFYHVPRFMSGNTYVKYLVPLARQGISSA